MGKDKDKKKTKEKGKKNKKKSVGSSASLDMMKLTSLSFASLVTDSISPLYEEDGMVFLSYQPIAYIDDEIIFSVGSDGEGKSSLFLSVMDFFADTAAEEYGLNADAAFDLVRHVIEESEGATDRYDFHYDEEQRAVIAVTDISEDDSAIANGLMDFSLLLASISDLAMAHLDDAAEEGVEEEEHHHCGCGHHHHHEDGEGHHCCHHHHEDEDDDDED